jgi:WD40 repeat protein
MYERSGKGFESCGPSIPLGSDVRGLAFSPDDRLLASASGKTVQFWDPATRLEVGRINDPATTEFWGVAFAGNDRVVTIAHHADQNKQVRHWKLTRKNATAGQETGQ